MIKRAIFLFALGILAACGGASTNSPAPDAGPPALHELRWEAPRADTNLVLIVTDTTRRDRLGAYGGDARTGAFDAFADDNILFEAAYTQSPWTKPSMATLFTSLYPSQHGVVSHPSLRERQGIEIKEADAWMDVMGDEYTTLAEVLRDGGIHTAALVGNPWLKREFGFAQGFDEYDDSFADWEVPGRRLTAAALDWLAARPEGERYFLYLHYMDAHRPYGTLTREEIDERLSSATGPSTVDPLPEAVREQIAPLVVLDDGTPAVDAGYQPSLELLTMAYDRGIESFDAALDDLVTGLESLPEWERTAVVIVSDHGEALYTRGWGNHGGGLYEDELAVPLAARLPGVSADDAVTTPVGLVDLMPTIATYMGAPLADGTPAFGRDWLAPAAEHGDLADRYLVSEGVMFRPNNRAVFRRGYKALWQPHLRSDGKERALFRIPGDAGEAHDLVAAEADPADHPDRAQPDAVEIFNDLLRGSREEVVEYSALGPQYMPLDPELERRLRALGYIGG